MEARNEADERRLAEGVLVEKLQEVGDGEMQAVLEPPQMPLHKELNEFGEFIGVPGTKEKKAPNKSTRASGIQLYQVFAFGWKFYQEASDVQYPNENF